MKPKGPARVLLGHGSGGKLSHSLVSDLFVRYLNNPALAALNDQAIVEIDGVRLAFTTDTYVIDPPFFPGGDIGSLAVHGTVNDLAVGGAEPLFLSLGMVLEEGFPMADLERIVKSISQAARQAGVEVVTGDTKVVGKGAADKIFINTSGVGRVLPGINLSGSALKPGDRLIINGTIGDHGLAVLAKRKELALELPLVSDSAPLSAMILKLVREIPGIHAMRDPTRGGVATILNEFASQSGVGIELWEDHIPLSPAAAGACELLGFDPLYIANEGKVVVAVEPGSADRVIETMKQFPEGKEAVVIGEVVDSSQKVFLKTNIGGRRVVDMLAADQLPRIC